MTNSYYNGQLYKEFQNSEDANEWAWANYLDILTHNEDNSSSYMSLYYYTGSMYKVWNSVLRYSPPIESDNFEKIAAGYFSSDGEQIRRIKEVNSVLRQHWIPENIVVYRYTHRSVLNTLCFPKKPKKGLCFADKGFFSTTMVKELLKDFSKKHRCNCLLKLYLPKGLPGAYVSPKRTLSNLNEQEILLPPNTQFEVVKIHHFSWPLLIECQAVL